MSPVPAPLSLPDGLVERPLTISDAAAVTAVMAAQEAHDTGTISIEEADILDDWGRSCTRCPPTPSAPSRVTAWSPTPR